MGTAIPYHLGPWPAVVYFELMEHYTEFLLSTVKAMVDFPDYVHIEHKTDEMGVLLTLTVHRDDMGKVIGRSGESAKAIRTLLRVVGMKNSARVNLKINEPLK